MYEPEKGSKSFSLDDLLAAAGAPAPNKEKPAVSETVKQDPPKKKSVNTLFAELGIAGAVNSDEKPQEKTKPEAESKPRVQKASQEKKPATSLDSLLFSMTGVPSREAVASEKLAEKPASSKPASIDLFAALGHASASPKLTPAEEAAESTQKDGEPEKTQVDEPQVAEFKNVQPIGEYEDATSLEEQPSEQEQLAEEPKSVRGRFADIPTYGDPAPSRPSHDLAPLSQEPTAIADTPETGEASAAPAEESQTKLPEAQLGGETHSQVLQEEPAVKHEAAEPRQDVTNALVAFEGEAQIGLFEAASAQTQQEAAAQLDLVPAKPHAPSVSQGAAAYVRPAIYERRESVYTSVAVQKMRAESDESLAAEPAEEDQGPTAPVAEPEAIAVPAEEASVEEISEAALEAEAEAAPVEPSEPQPEPVPEIESEDGREPKKPTPRKPEKKQKAAGNTSRITGVILVVAAVVLGIVAACFALGVIQLPPSASDPANSDAPVAQQDELQQGQPTTQTYKYQIPGLDGQPYDATEVASFDADGYLKQSEITVVVPDQETANRILEQMKVSFGDEFISGEVSANAVTFVVDSSTGNVDKETYDELMAGSIVE